MKLTFVNRYFWPETVLVNEIAQWAAREGHDVTALVGQPDYNPEMQHPDRPKHEDFNGVAIRRVSGLRTQSRGGLRNLYGLVFILAATLAVLFGRRSDAVWSTSIPPILQPLLLRIATKLRGIRFIYFPQDIYPEIALCSGMMKPGLIARLLKAIDGWTLRHADCVVTISHDMADVLAARGARRERLSVIRSFSPYPLPEPIAREPGAPCSFLFAGNIGRFQQLDTLVEAFAAIDPELAILDFLGEGREKARLQARVREMGLANVRFFDGVSAIQAQEFSAKADVGIISLSPEIYRYAFPAKTYTYLAAGLPLLAIVEPESELAEIVRTRDIGEVVDSTKGPDAVRAAIQRVIDNFGSHQQAVATKTDDLHRVDNARRQWMELFSDMEKAR